jgi:hypothetical protein
MPIKLVYVFNRDGSLHDRTCHVWVILDPAKACEVLVLFKNRFRKNVPLYIGSTNLNTLCAKTRLLEFSIAALEHWRQELRRNDITLTRLMTKKQIKALEIGADRARYMLSFLKDKRKKRRHDIRQRR